MSFREFLTEAQFGASTFGKVIAILEKRISRKIGARIFRYGGSDGVQELSLNGKKYISYLYFTESGRAFRLNTFRYKIETIDVWKKYTTVKNPDFTMDLGELNSVALLSFIDDIAKFIKNPKAESISVYFLPESNDISGTVLTEEYLTEARRSNPLEFYNFCKEKLNGDLTKLSWEDINSVASEHDVQVPTFIRSQKTGKGLWSVVPPGVDNKSGEVEDEKAVETAAKKGNDPILYIKVTARDPASNKFKSASESKEAQELYKKIQGVLDSPEEPTIDELKNPDTLFGHLYDLSSLTAKRKLNSLLIYGGPGTGKAQPLYSKIKIPGGWKAMGEMKVGDDVTAHDGSTVKITGVYPQGPKDVYELTLSDGRTARASDEHLWTVYDKRGNKRNKTTIEIFNEFNSTKRYRFGIPRPKPEKKSDVNLPVNPYVLGTLIGDGSFRGKKISFTNTDEHIISKVNLLLENGYSLYPQNEISYTLRREIQGNKDNRNEYISKIRDLGMFGLYSNEKFIPEEYKESSYNQKVELIQGLLDTDGYASKNGELIYTTTSEVLANDFVYLIRSIGGRALLKKKTNKVCEHYLDSYDISIQHSDMKNFVSLGRKQERISDKPQYGDSLLFIKKIEKVSVEECQCISIDHPDHLYITDDFIVTHNTFTVMKAIKDAGLNQGTDYVKLSGKATPVSVYQLLYKWRNGGLVVFDDLDSIWKDKDAANILKAVLDTGDERVVDWQSNRTVDLSRKTKEEKEKYMADLDKRLESGADLGNDSSDEDDEEGSKKKGPLKFPASFEFKSSIIFISNLPKDSFDTAIMSRSAKINMDLTPEQVLARMMSVLPHLGDPSVPLEKKKELVEHLYSLFKKKTFDALTFREYVKCEKILASGISNWKELMIYA